MLVEPTSKQPLINLSPSILIWIVIAAVIYGLAKNFQRVRIEDVDRQSPTEFELLIKQMLFDQGYKVEHTGGRGDRGVDLVAEKGKGEFTKRFMVQVKHRQSGKQPIGVNVVRSSYGAAHDLIVYDSIIVVTNARFTKGAVEFSQGKALQLISREEIQKWLREAGLRRYHLWKLSK